MKVVVLMSTYNGEKYIETQLDSILAQQGVDVDIIVRDDGSTDSTHEILDRYQNEGKLKWYTGENLKPAKSFMNLVYNAPDSEYYAFADQDDYWFPDKLSTAVKRLSDVKKTRPALYYSRYIMTDKDLNTVPLPKDTPYVSLTLKQAMISSAATGCTMVFNKKLIEYLQMAKPDFQIMHDNWTHKVCAVLNGVLCFDEKAHIYYRQHGDNVIGGESTLLQRMKRHLHSAFVDPCYRSRSIMTLYECYKEYMPENNKKICKMVADYHKGLNRFRIINDKEFRTGNQRIDFIFIVAVLLGIF